MDNLGQHFWNKKEMLSLLSMLSFSFRTTFGALSMDRVAIYCHDLITVFIVEIAFNVGE